MERGHAFVRRRMQFGEIGAAREALDRSGKTVAELVEQWGETQRLRYRRRNCFQDLIGAEHAILRGDWSSDVCSSDLLNRRMRNRTSGGVGGR